MSSKVAIITGAGSGIGRATAVALSKCGYAVALAGRRKEQLEQTARLCGDQATVIPADITDSAQCDQLIAKTLKRLNRVDVLVNNAGYAPMVPIEKLTAQEWNHIVATNLSAAVYLIRAVWPIFQKQGGGVIVNISSESARDPFPGLEAYGAAKAGLNLLTKALATEGAKHNIRLYAIAPGAVETGMLRAIVTNEQYPTEKTLGPDDVAALVMDCVQGHLQYTSGETIYVNKTLM